MVPHMAHCLAYSRCPLTAPAVDGWINGLACFGLPAAPFEADGAVPSSGPQAKPWPHPTGGQVPARPTSMPSRLPSWLCSPLGLFPASGPLLMLSIWTHPAPAAFYPAGQASASPPPRNLCNCGSSVGSPLSPLPLSCVLGTLECSSALAALAFRMERREMCAQRNRAEREEVPGRGWGREEWAGAHTLPATHLFLLCRSKLRGAAERFTGE